MALLALLPLAFGVDVSRCDWHDSVERKGDTGAREVADGYFGLSVKAGDGDITKALRAAIEQRLHAGGVTNLVDNPVTRPRADVVLEEGQMRWLPFYASVKARVRVLLTRKGKIAEAGLDTRATVEGTCWGLVSQHAWRNALIDRLADHAAHGILPDK
ncbi:MAG: hypothetical protein A2138_08635 [Deltaproteobacteria bacterium RBG_16_71_12]|nr:MAG: hypothetical protein A2138_08635 [Deltaproteobacteria bacterium RBG_16_71_12]